MIAASEPFWLILLPILLGYLPVNLEKVVEAAKEEGKFLEK